MVLADMRQLLALNHIRKGVVRRERQSNGWLVALEDFDGVQYTLTCRSGQARSYSSWNTATRLLRRLGVERITVADAY